MEWLPYVEEALEPDDVVGFGKRSNGMFYVGTAHPPAVRAMEWLVDARQHMLGRLTPPSVRLAAQLL